MVEETNDQLRSGTIPTVVRWFWLIMFFGLPTAFFQQSSACFSSFFQKQTSWRNNDVHGQRKLKNNDANVNDDQKNANNNGPVTLADHACRFTHFAWVSDCHLGAAMPRESLCWLMLAHWFIAQMSTSFQRPKWQWQVLFRSWWQVTVRNSGLVRRSKAIPTTWYLFQTFFAAKKRFHSVKTFNSSTCCYWIYTIESWK